MTRRRLRLLKRDDGTISRGVRRFMMLLGAEVAPRLVKTEGKYWGSDTRTRDLRAVGAERVEHDWTSPDLEKMMTALPALAKRSKKEARARSAALFKALARNWDRLYAPHLTVNALPKKRIKVSQPAKREPETKTRMLKPSVGPISNASITAAERQAQPVGPTKPINAP